VRRRPARRVTNRSGPTRDPRTSPRRSRLS